MGARAACFVGVLWTTSGCRPGRLWQVGGSSWRHQIYRPAAHYVLLAILDVNHRDLALFNMATNCMLRGRGPLKMEVADPPTLGQILGALRSCRVRHRSLFDPGNSIEKRIGAPCSWHASAAQSKVEPVGRGRQNFGDRCKCNARFSTGKSYI